ncbi:hypothetical protein [Pseudoalteromonas sp. KAN5]|uniref:hypothetical protein n=1 Tax=Pseudoalteromonas sp. KAN5 TaxID=2916633 RepID=UPI001FCB9780|nr:hypothetical protein [Pseudoalteromonas sp. KAN5]BDF96490.1 hypothetical protein KAN5_33280 [Pseudoalteromonas sp. KAN5]
MLARKYYKYKEAAKQLGCSYDDMEDYIYRQYVIRPCINYNGYAVGSSHQSGSKPSLIKLNGAFEVDLSSLSTTRTIISGVGIVDSNDHFITRIYHEDSLLRLVYLSKTTRSSEYGFSHVTNNKVRFEHQPTELLFLKETIDKLTLEVNSEIPELIIPTQNPHTTTPNAINDPDKIEQCKQTVKSQGFAKREQLSIITGKSTQTLANKASQNPNSSGWDKEHKRYSTENIKKFYGIDLL